MNITYKLFAPDGLPLRATVSASFQEVIREDLDLKKINPTSPDVSHTFDIKEGDTLPRMAEKVYGDQAYYIAIAQANKLIQFRNLKAGNRLVVPPVKKFDD
ncbi:MAG: LysM peptidoglycan-binding domain-containing protein [Lewinellaceae bacterium]|nr:LysM peptidoglycan-binding domain-containing protein [Lewinellaceae bacterium]